MACLPQPRPIYGEEVDLTLYEHLQFNIIPYIQKSPLSLLIFGASGSGKEGRGSFLLEYFRLDGKVSSGDIFRALGEKIGDEAVSVIKDKRTSLEGSADPEELDGLCQDPQAILGFFDSKGIVGYEHDFEAIGLFQSVCGCFVDSEVSLYLMEQEFLKESYKGKHLVFDGHIRMADQVLPIMKMIENNDSSLDAVMVVDADLRMLQERTVGRRVCKFPNGCDLEYNALKKYAGIDQAPLEVEGKLYCTEHKEQELTHRVDDHPKPVARRLGEYRDHANSTLDALKQQLVYLMMVNGNLQPYSSENKKTSLLEAINADNPAVLARF